MNISSMKKQIVDTDVVNDVTFSRQSVNTRVVIRYYKYLSCVFGVDRKICHEGH